MRTRDYRVTYRERRGDPVLLWTIFANTTMNRVREKALSLLDDLREEGFKHAAVFIEGKRVQKRKRGDK